MVNKKGFFKALMTVALAMMSVSIFATAPVITDPGDFLIGDAEQGITNNIFVFPDAFDFDANVVDDNTPDASIKWSFLDLTGKYTINGVASFAGDYNNPTNDLRQTDNDTGTAGQDGSAGTATLRNANLSPNNTPNPVEPGPAGIQAGETATVTLFASDCTTYSSQSVVLYTTNDASDSLSGGVLTNIWDYDFEGTPSLASGWISQILPNSTGGTVANTGSGLCMWVPLTNLSGAQVVWLSPHNQSNTTAPGYVELVDLAAYRFRATMSCDNQGTIGTQPIWTFGYNNNFYTGTNGALQSNMYGGDAWVMDAAGGAMGTGRSQGRSDFDFWALPPATKTDAWRGTLPGGNPENTFSVVNSPTSDNRNDMNVGIRILDSPDAPSANTRTGTLCLKRLRCDRLSLNDLQSSVSWAPTMSESNFRALPDEAGTGAGNGTADVRNATQDARFVVGGPYETNTAGGRKLLIFYNAAGTSTKKKDYAVGGNWVNDQINGMTGNIRSDVNNGAGPEGSAPVNIIFCNFESITNEIGGFNFVQMGIAGNFKRAGGPRLLATTGGVPQEYIELYACNNSSLAVAPVWEGHAKSVRPLFDFINNQAIGSATDGRDPFIITNVKQIIVDQSNF
jgi:hypothetical protein